MDSQQILIISSTILPLIVAITLHEAGHAFAANMLGDPTAKRMGRMSLDPLRHVDPFGTIFLPGLLILSHAPMLFGWAKPVPVDFRNLKKPRRDTILVALAGPGMNLILAFISALLLHLDVLVTPEKAPWMFMNFYSSVTVNIVLGIFNLLPILPLDGGRILNALLPPRLTATHARSERYGTLILLAVMAAGVLNVPVLDYLVMLPADYVRDGVFHLAGIGDG